jgi:hypothetical protein
MATPRILPAPKRPDEESLAFRATVSPPHLRRVLPKPALPAAPPTPAAELRGLLRYPFPEPVWKHLVQRALDSNSPVELARALAQVKQRKADHEAGQAKLQKVLPKLYPKST